MANQYKKTASFLAVVAFWDLNCCYEKKFETFHFVINLAIS